MANTQLKRLRVLLIPSHFLFTLLLFQASSLAVTSAPTVLPQEPSTKIDVNYDPEKDRTTVKLAPRKIASNVGKYHSIHISPSFSFSGRNHTTPDIVDFEMQTVVKGRLRTDLYVVFVIDGETVFLSSNRSAIKRPVPGRVWVGERLVFRMPYATFVRAANAKTFAIKLDGLSFEVSDDDRKTLRELLSNMKPAS